MAVGPSWAQDDWESQLAEITEGATPDLVAGTADLMEGEVDIEDPDDHPATSVSSFTLDRDGVPVPEEITKAMENDVFTIEGLERTLHDDDHDLTQELAEIMETSPTANTLSAEQLAQQAAADEKADAEKIGQALDEAASDVLALPDQAFSLEDSLQNLMAETSPEDLSAMEHEDQLVAMAVEDNPLAAFNARQARLNAKQDFDWANLDSDQFFDLNNWLRDLKARKENPYWAGNRSYADHELVGFVLDCVGECWRYTQRGHHKVEYRTPLYETDEIMTGQHGHLWAFLVEGTMVRLAPNSSLTLQEIDIGLQENFLYARLNYGNLAWLSRNDGLFVPQTKAETDALFLPLPMEAANFVLPEKMTTEDNLAIFLDQDYLYQKAYDRLNQLITENNKFVNRPTYSFLVLPNGVLWGKNMMAEAVTYLGSDSYFKALDASFYQPPLPVKVKPKEEEPESTIIATSFFGQKNITLTSSEQKNTPAKQEDDEGNDHNKDNEESAESENSEQALGQNSEQEDAFSGAEKEKAYPPPRQGPQIRFYFRRLGKAIAQEVEVNTWYRLDKLSSMLERQESSAELNFDLLEFPIQRIPTIFTARELWLAERPTKIFAANLSSETLAASPRYRLWGHLTTDRLAAETDEEEASSTAIATSADTSTSTTSSPSTPANSDGAIAHSDNLQQRVNFLKKYVMRIEMSSLFKLDMYRRQLELEGKEFVLEIPGINRAPRFTDFYQDAITAYGHQPNHMALDLEQEHARLNSTQQPWWRQWRLKHRR